ncbi:MAG TPA: sigma-54 dependent transcriptional regulator [Candidatus Eisenbacteria bacterium]|nr:sigma-54 dependent transcriptional regulator [Candidatus Eisenbacteria bacterium]
MSISTLRPVRKSAKGGIPSDSLYKDIVGASPRMQRILRLVSRVAPTDSTVLLLGESGTGKELIARSIHVQSRRARGPFVPVNVGAIPDGLVESELFGYARGAFTGAAVERAGLVEEADGGTLFLDEIADMPVQAQVKLLRTLESNEVRRLGDNVTRLVDLRVVAATHRNLRALVDEGRFREDLYYRLNVVQIELPPLRDRREDIGLLASYFLTRIAERMDRNGLQFSPEAMEIVERYDYPGNVRELENAIEHAVALSEGRLIRPADLPTALRTPRMLPTHGEPGSAAGGSTVRDVGHPSAALSENRDAWSLADVEKEHIRRVLTLHKGNATSAAKQLGISRTTLWRKLRQYGLQRRPT